MWLKRVQTIVAVVLIMGGAGWLVSTVASRTEATIAANNAARDAALAIELIGVATPLDVDAILVCEAPGDLLVVDGDGYGGPLRVAIVTERGRAVGVQLVSHVETPGFVDFLDAPSPFLEALLNGEGPGVDAVTGATVTANAIRQTFAEGQRRLVEPVWEGLTFAARKEQDCSREASIETQDG